MSRDGFGDDEMIQAVDAHMVRLGLGSALMRLWEAEQRILIDHGGDMPDGCRRHTCREECLGAAAQAALQSMGLEVMPSTILDVAERAMVAQLEGGQVVVQVPHPTMYEAMRSHGKN